jgi:hypothetical protein
MVAPITDQKSAPDFITAVLGYFIGATVYTAVHFVAVSFVTFLFTAGSLFSSNRASAGYVFLVVLGWAIIFGQLEAFNKIDTGNEDVPAVVQFFQIIATFVYYNGFLALAVTFAIAFQQAGFPGLATATALGAPIADISISRSDNLPGGVAYWMFRGAEWCGEKVIGVYDRIPAKRIFSALVLRVDYIYSSIKDGIPATASHLSVSSVTRRRTH